MVLLACCTHVFSSRMRFSSSFRTAMASPFTVHRLHMRGRNPVVKCLNTIETILRRSEKPVIVVVFPPGEKDEPKSLSELMADRQEQAEKSVLISCPSRTNEKKFLKFLSKHGDINKHFFYESYGVYAVVEFARRDSVASLLESAAIPSVNHECMVPFKSRLLSLSNQSLAASTDRILPALMSLQVDDQIGALTETYQLTEENSRLRFLVCSLLKDVAAAYFPECTIRPFGSSVNGFGKLGCDLDMFLDLDSISGWNFKPPKSGLSLEYQMKRTNSERHVTQSILSVIGECVDHFWPGCVGVQKILNARCPLVRFAHQPSGFQCDLTANNRVAMKSTELLYLYGELDPRVRSLVFTVRCWARAHGVTSSIPGAWITNFSLTVMVLFFLQKRSPPIIPTLDRLRDLAGPADESVIEGNDCTFATDFSKIQLQSNTDTLEQLLGDFFEFYAMFPFSRMSINIRKGREQNKPEMAPLHIQNPFETSLNVSKNVNTSQLDRFVALCQESAWLLQQSETRTQRGSSGNRTTTPWGLATLLLPSKVVGIKGRKKYKKEGASERIKSLLETLKNKNEEPKS
uniref:Mitochondrial poly(A) polymerase n=1 Tax=Xiphophorus couchianus TaxID=32473 RepID=A0A3B5KXE8_9TELE